MAKQHNEPVDVLFINPPAPDNFIYIRDINRHGRSSWERMIWPQTSLAYLASMAEEAKHTVDIIDCIAERIDWPEYEAIIKKCRPRYVVSNIISVTYSNDLRALRYAKDTCNSITIGMGPHLTDKPAESLQESDVLDYVFTHEAENTMKELLELYAKTPEPTLKALGEVKGIAFVPNRVGCGDSTESVVTMQRPFIKEMDAFPWPRHDLLPLDKYWAPFLGHYTFVEASRGCAYRCIYCRQAVMQQWKFRSRSGKDLAKEALYVHSLGVENILFHADTFTMGQKMVHDMCDVLIEAGTPFRWACNTHVKQLYNNKKMAQKMKDAGCWMIACGIESGDNQVLENIKKDITVEQAEWVVNVLDEVGIEAWGYFMVGNIGETMDTMKKTLDFALRLPFLIAKFDIAAPYPGTEFYKIAKEMGYLRIDNYEDFDQNSSAVAELPDLTRAQIKSFARKAHLRFFLRPRILMYFLKQMRDFTTIKTIFAIARDQFLLLGKGKRTRKDATVEIDPSLKENKKEKEKSYAA